MFEDTIYEIVESHFGENSEYVLESSSLLQYVKLKTRSVSSGSKARSSFGNLYAIYVLVEDYIDNNYHMREDYSSYKGAKFGDLFRRQRKLPFGAKLQNHALNHRLNQEFIRLCPSSGLQPIVRNLETKRYWFNEQLLTANTPEKVFNIAEVVIEIIDSYMDAKVQSFDQFLAKCRTIKSISKSKPESISDFISKLLDPNEDARIFEIVTFSILKAFYSEQSIFSGREEDDVQEDYLTLYRTGRCNANDGGIDFVMKPLGRFFQVTEDIDMKKYFLDIEKIQKYPITFVVKSELPIEQILETIENQAKKLYPDDSYVQRYMACIEELINIPVLLDRLSDVISAGNSNLVLDEIINQSEVEFHM